MRALVAPEGKDVGPQLQGEIVRAWVGRHELKPHSADAEKVRQALEVGNELHEDA